MATQGPTVNAARAVGNASAPKLNASSGSSVPASSNSGAAGSGLVARMKDFIQKNMLVVVFIGIVLLIFVIVIIYIVFSMKGAGLSGKTLTTSPIRLDGNNTPKSIAGDSIPIPVVGREYTYSFWVYLENYSQTPGTSKMLWYRGQDSSIAAANPIVYMDDMSNKMYVVLKTQNSTLSGSGPNKDYDANIGLVKENNYFLNKKATINDDSNKHIVMTVDYVPLQRWVNYTIIVDNKIVTLYMDGEIYSVKSIDEFKAMKDSEYDERGNKVDYNLILDKTEGSIYVGKNPVGSKNITINGYLSKFDFFNYAVSADDVKKVYNVGPFPKSFLALLGAGQYSVRSPIYKVSESTQ
jgi:hypothetical protein